MRASTAGWRFMTLVTKLPTRTRLVVAAAAVSVVQHSSTGSESVPRLTKWSHAQTVRKPAASQRLADSSHQAISTPMVARLTPIGIIGRSDRAAGLECHLDHPVGGRLEIVQ